MKCKICGGEIKPGAMECQYCGNTDFVPDLFSEDEFEAEKRIEPPRESKPLYTDLTGDETVVVRNTQPIREKFCRKCGRELNPNGKCRVCDNDNIENIRPVTDDEDEQLSGRKNIKMQKDKINPALKLVLIVFLMLILFAISYMIFFNWMKELSEQEQSKPTETPVVVTEAPIDDSSDKARWEPTSTSMPVISTPQAVPTPAVSKEAESPAPEIDSKVTHTPVESKAGVYMYDSQKTVITEEELEQLDRSTIKIIYNEIYARHGMKFNDSELKAYFEAQEWYKGTTSSESEAESQFSSIEKQNRTIIYNYQKEKGWRN